MSVNWSLFLTFIKCFNEEETKTFKMNFKLIFAIVAFVISSANCIECPEACTMEYSPVCASNGVQYGNKCEFKKANCNKQLTYTDGECKKSANNCEKIICPAIYDPVCGSDGVNYENACSLEKKNCERNTKITSTKGKCPESPSNGCEKQVRCSEEEKSVCGSDGKTYPNYCLWYTENCANPKAKYTNGSCTECPDSCIQIYQPVCGSDGKTYGNACVLAQENCKNKTKITSTEGACKTDEGNICTADYRPVCGSDGVTYSNLCQFKANRKDKNATYTEGKCHPKDVST